MVYRGKNSKIVIVQIILDLNVHAEVWLFADTLSFELLIYLFYLRLV